MSAILNKRKQVYVALAKAYGEDAQQDMCVEECSELIKAICKFRRNPSAENYKEMIGEIADVEIMVEQMRLMFDRDGLVNLIKKQKLERVVKRMDKDGFKVYFAQ